MNLNPTLARLLNGAEVEWKSLEEISRFYGGLTGKNKNDFEKGNAKYITYKNIFANLEIDISILETVNVAENENQHLVKYGDILFTGSSETAIEAGMSSAVTTQIDEPIYLNSFSFGVRFNSDVDIIPEFAKYLFRSNLMRKEIAKTASGVTRFNISKERFKKIKIPIPPLSTQKEIVKILDKLTELEATLEAELSLRQKQYHYYRDHLLTFGEDVEWKSLGEVAEYSTTRIKYDLLTEKNYVGVDNLLQNRMGKTISNYVPISGNLTQFIKSDILIGNIRPYLKKIWQADCEGGTNGDVLVIRIKDSSIIPRFLYQVLADDKFFEYNMKYAKGAKMPRGNKSAILQFQFPVPSLTIQEKIVEILDKFETFTNSISEGLPKEIELRRKQYEYYREMLLSFPKS